MEQRTERGREGKAQMSTAIVPVEFRADGRSARPILQ